MIVSLFRGEKGKSHIFNQFIIGKSVKKKQILNKKDIGG